MNQVCLDVWRFYTCLIHWIYVYNWTKTDSCRLILPNYLCDRQQMNCWRLRTLQEWLHVERKLEGKRRGPASRRPSFLYAWWCDLRRKTDVPQKNVRTPGPEPSYPQKDAKMLVKVGFRWLSATLAVFLRLLLVFSTIVDRNTLGMGYNLIIFTHRGSLRLLSRCIVVMIFVISSSIGCFSPLLAIETHFFFAHIVLQWIEISFRGSKWAEQVEKLLRL